jgi:hypothetical protein
MASTSRETWKAREAIGLPASRQQPCRAAGVCAEGTRAQASRQASKLVLTVPLKNRESRWCCTPTAQACQAGQKLFGSACKGAGAHQKCAERCTALCRHPTAALHDPATPRPAGLACACGSGQPRVCGGGPLEPAPACRWHTSSASQCGRRCSEFRVAQASLFWIKCRVLSAVRT